MGLIIGMGAFFIAMTVIFVAIAVFAPETLGITGKKAKDVIAQQDGSSLNSRPKSEVSTPDLNEDKLKRTDPT